jgi:hypothetical protein
MKDRGGPFARLLDLHTFTYERDTYPNYTQITRLDAEKNCLGIWKWINAAMPADKSGRVRHGVKECLFVLFGKPHNPSVVAHTWCEPNQAKEYISAHEIPEMVDPIAVLESWLRHEPPIHGIELSPRAYSKVVTFYLLFESQVEIKELSDFLKRPTFIASGGLLKTQRGSAKTVREILSEPSGGHYYQRLCVVFGCEDEESAIRLKPLAKQIVCGLITTWGGALERAKERAKAAEMEAQAWSHEVGNFIRYLSWTDKNKSQHLYELTIDFLEIGTRATIKMTALPEVLKSWPKLSADKMILHSVDLGSRFAVLREYRGDHEAIKTVSGLEKTVDEYKARFAAPKIMASGLRFAATDRALGSYQQLGAFAQFIIFAFYSAARYSKMPSSIQVELRRDRLWVSNPISIPAQDDIPKSEVRAILHQAFRALWDNTRDDFTYGPENDNWVTACYLPNSLWEEA